MSDRIIIFTRFPAAGECKTRLIPFLGAEGAARLQLRMTAGMIETGRAYTEKNPGSSLEIRYHGGSARLMAKAFGEGYYREQTEGDLGRRMSEAVENSLREGAGSVVLTGSDCPDISVELLENAFAGLRDHDLVIGPASDGGYYLIGMNKPLPGIFPDNMPWGSASVFKLTLRAAKKSGLSVFLLPKLADVDTPADIARIYDNPALMGKDPIISVVIPALNEAGLILQTIESAKGSNTEIIVADGGSTDGTDELAVSAGARLVRCAKGRGRQMNAGAAQASGEIIIFLHADTILPEGFILEVITALSKPYAAAGAFKFGLSGSGITFKIISMFTNLRSMLFKLPYGDQAVFMRKEKFIASGGFPDIPVMEDYALILRLKKTGRIIISHKAVKTSGRRWKKLGYFRTMIINQCMIAGYHLGLPIEKLEKFYSRN